MNYTIALGFAAAIIFVFRKIWNKNTWNHPATPFPPQWRIILAKKVNFYNSLSGEEKTLFEYKVQEFLLNCRVTGIQVQIDETDHVLVASSAIFGLPMSSY